MTLTRCGHGLLDHLASGSSVALLFLIQRRLIHTSYSYSLRHPPYHILDFFLTWKTIQDIVSEFTKMIGVPITKTWSPTVTHVIASTDKNGACKRTLKFLMAILDGKWILSVDCKSNIPSLGKIISGVLMLLKLLTSLYQFFFFAYIYTGIKACMEAREPVDEEKYEITVDVHGISRCPRLGRLKEINKVILTRFFFHAVAR